MLLAFVMSRKNKKAKEVETAYEKLQRLGGLTAFKGMSTREILEYIRTYDD
jgi:hypothetical protein